jgi:hypothetical protein
MIAGVLVSSHVMLAYMTETTAAPTAAAVRARRYRERKRNGIRCVQVWLGEARNPGID